MLVRPQHEYSSEGWNPHIIKYIKKIGQIQRNPWRCISQDYHRDTDTSLLSNQLNLESLYICRFIKQATMLRKIHYNLADICPPSYIQHAIHISSRTYLPLKNCNKNPSQINAYKCSFSLAVWIFGVKLLDNILLIVEWHSGYWWISYRVSLDRVGSNLVIILGIIA